MVKRYFLMITVILFMICSTEITAGQDIEELCPEAKVYENWNQVDYGPLKLVDIYGQAILDYDGKHPGDPVPRVCLSLFSEEDHQWIETTMADDEGRFSFGPIKRGRYRLVARSPFMCPANIPLLLIKSDKENIVGSKRLIIHFVLQGREACSFGELEE